jgi:hypothetical protein
VNDEFFIILVIVVTVDCVGSDGSDDSNGVNWTILVGYARNMMGGKSCHVWMESIISH